MILCCLLKLSAQITLHEATDVTQTKATLSADFPDLNSEHGFQYKYGTLPMIDEFSRVALSESSDPVKLNTTSNAWSARTVKGWVESKSNLSVGQASVMSAKVKFSEPTTVAFEWSVDSEEGVGILSFIVDGKSVSEISGYIDFKEVLYQVTAGEHTLVWQYKKTAATNVGLDLGKVRNIDLQNTTEGEWITEISQTSELQLVNLYPEQDYIYRAYSQRQNSKLSVTYSSLSSFSSLPIQIGNTIINPISQTKANINVQTEFGDAEVETGINIFKNTHYDNDAFARALLADDTYGSKMIFNDINYKRWNISDTYNCVSSTQTLSITLSITSPTTISFELANTSFNKTCSPSFYIDETRYGPYYISENSKPGNFRKFTFKISEGVHTIEWIGGSHVVSLNTIYYGTNYIRNLSIPNLEKVLFTSITSHHDKETKYRVENLTPNTTYYIEPYVNPVFESNLPYGWIQPQINITQFNTLPVYANSSTSIEVKQASATIRGKVDGGDATIIATGLQYKDATGKRWTDYPKGITEKELSQNITRLKPNTTYHYRSYIQAQDCDTVFSEIGEFTTLAVEALKPTAKRISQHEAELQGKVRFGDASIYQRGLQFRKKGADNWEEVEDGGNDSIYTLVKKNLEMGATYEARTYVQPAGCDVIYSEILEFRTLNSYFVSCNSNESSQTTVTFAATLSDVDEDVAVERYGFEYYIDSDGFFENADSYVKSEVYDVPVIPNHKEIKATVSGLCPSLILRWRAYALVDGNKFYFTGLNNNGWKFAGTDRATIKVSIDKITQTSIALKLDASQEGDLQVSKIEYALANSVQDTEAYSICGNTLTLRDLDPGRQYNIRFRGTVNGRVFPLLKEISWDYSWFEYQTLPVTVDVEFSNISQTKANMRVKVNSGDALISELGYRIWYGELLQCQENNHLTNLAPAHTYAVTINAKVNGKEMTWSANASDEPFRFITRAVTSSVSVSDISQTSAKIKWSSDYGDATYLSSGLEVGSVIFNSENEDFEKIMTELLPGQSYSCRSFVETEEGGRVYSSSRTFTTKSIECEILPVSNISNRSATMNGTIECDSYSSAEFGFQWKQMEGWASAPAFTKGRKLDDGTISVALVNGILEPNTDYQYRTAVRYQDHIYYAPNWVTFRTESEFIYYPAAVYTMFRTDRENNALVLCGYYVAGSESVVSQGYEYWQTGSTPKRAQVPQSPIIITTDDSMQHEFTAGELPNGDYNVRAFVKTESGATIYGATLGFTSSANGYSGVENIESELPYIVAERGVVKVYNANQLNCTIYSVDGKILANRMINDSYDEFRLTPGNFIIVTLSNGLRKKIII